MVLDYVGRFSEFLSYRVKVLKSEGRHWVAELCDGLGSCTISEISCRHVEKPSCNASWMSITTIERYLDRHIDRKILE